MVEFEITPYSPEFRDPVIELTLEAWKPVFPLTRQHVPGFVYEAFWPQGWEVRQAREVSSLLENGPTEVWLGFQGDALAGFVGILIHPEDQMGEVSIIAVSPAYQGQGVGRALMEFAERQVRAAGMKMVMVETGGDPGHTPARHTYESLGYERWPVARYFKEL
jgi:GNAT superfamily N-acetyltransferase